MTQTSPDAIRQILSSVRTIAVVGASPNPSRDSHIVAAFLAARGYRVFPVNPGHGGKEIAGLMTYASLAEVPEPIDMVDVFRASEHVPAVLEETLALANRPGVFWTQLGVRDDASAARAEAAGLAVVMDRCPKIEIAELGLPRRSPEPG
ncbi:CoA-binding protein [Methylopila turkensis]|uniref:CoA-binding protein n=1 Tax=Methylopila turkensis TaxID=1437816 RepID=A0A9W6JNS1_9HYPH|nr:CoA-binding protein [Methylopila turkensis]GLK81031.1 CoA-binding protein [Methylopila turkensis]